MHAFIFCDTYFNLISHAQFVLHNNPFNMQERNEKIEQLENDLNLSQKVFPDPLVDISPNKKELHG